MKTFIYPSDFNIKKLSSIIVFNFKSKLDVRKLATQVFKNFFNIFSRSK